MSITKGKWMVAKAGEHQYQVVADIPYDHGITEKPDTETLVCNVAWMQNLKEEEIQANANLIAVAPELLTSLKEIRLLIDDGRIELKINAVDAYLKSIDAILKKAEGK